MQIIIQIEANTMDSYDNQHICDQFAAISLSLITKHNTYPQIIVENIKIMQYINA
mgnify:CR=1 FL=1